MLEFILGKLISAPIIGSLIQPIITGLVTAQKQKLDAAGSHEARVAEITARELELDGKEADINAKILIAEQGNWVTRWVRPVWAAPFVAYTWKVVIWDKMLAWGHTDPLDARMWQVFMAIVIAYFGGRSAEKVANTIAGAFGKK